MNFRDLYNGFKKIYRSLKLERTVERFNEETNNAITSTNVSLKAIVGHDIMVLSGVYICDQSRVDSYTFIGDNSSVSKSTIGRYNSIASNVSIGHGEHPLDTISSSGHFTDSLLHVLTAKDCVIEHDVWLGVGSIVRRGVTIGAGAVVGANSFVNKDVPPFAIVAGSPAKIIKYRFSEEKIREILSSEWWMLDIDEAREVIKKLEITTAKL